MDTQSGISLGHFLCSALAVSYNSVFLEDKSTIELVRALILVQLTRGLSLSSDSDVSLDN